MKNQIIAQLLIKASINVVLSEAEDWLKKRHPKSSLKFKVGSGKRTYHMAESNDSSLIVYGKKMVSSKMKSYQECANWLTSKEIKERNYFNGEITPQTTLAAVVLHETAHYFQVLKWGRVYGSVHNDYFYKILDRMHYNGLAQRVYDYLMQFETFSSLTFDQEHEESRLIAEFGRHNLKIGDKIQFKDHKGKIIDDTVVKLNPKRVKCKRYIIPYTLISNIISD